MSHLPQSSPNSEKKENLSTDPHFDVEIDYADSTVCLGDASYGGHCIHIKESMLLWLATLLILAASKLEDSHRL